MANNIAFKLAAHRVWNCSKVARLFLPLFSDSAALASGEAELNDFGQVAGFDYLHVTSILPRKLILFRHLMSHNNQ